MTRSKKDWNYTDASTGRMTGLMVCCTCHKKIESGMYRYYDAGKSYVNQHRHCCEDAAAWKKIDRQIAEMTEHNRQFLKACIEFRDKWHVSELNEIIENLQDSLEMFTRDNT